MKKEIRDFTPVQLEAFANIKLACMNLDMDETEEVLTYAENEFVYFAGIKAYES